MLILTASGMFKELKTAHKNPPLRFFFKTLVIVPSETGGFCICNEEVHISNATPDQAKVCKLLFLYRLLIKFCTTVSI